MSVHNFLIHQEKERLVSLADISPRIHVFPYYFHQKIPGAQPCCYVREGVAERLIAAASLLPADLQLVVLDGWRPYEVQLALYENIKSQVMTDHPQASPSDILEILHTFVAKPSQDIERPSPHMSGGAVDVTLGTEQGWLDMGTGFDEISERSATAWYEEHQDETNGAIRENRRLLVDCMTRAGFTNYEAEWWHYDFGNHRWAALTGQTVLYKGILHRQIK